jgi:hypothetical protein
MNGIGVWFKGTGAFRFYPGMHPLPIKGYCKSDGALAETTCPTADWVAGRAYDPRDRPWFKSAEAAKGSIIFEGPFLDAWATGNRWLFAVSKAVYLPGVTPGADNALAVITLEVPVDDLKARIGAINMLSADATVTSLVRYDGGIVSDASFGGAADGPLPKIWTAQAPPRISQSTCVVTH